ncbi:MAG: GNAT family N-acetyltransferase [Dehalococcoidia bacterium]|nr:GNAT family N-acetyltransferase [Dehalococcoidia bacterium]
MGDAGGLKVNRSDAIECVRASDLDATCALELATLLSRAFTDERHVTAFSGERAEAWLPHVARVQAADPRDHELMPQSFLDAFPTLRNARRPAPERREGLHLVIRRDGYLATHVSLWPQAFTFSGERISGGYIEDVATDPLCLGRGFASQAMRAAEVEARALGLDVLGLATEIGPFYERLGWRTWDGHHTMTIGEHVFPDEPLMLLPLTPSGERMAAGSGDMRSERLPRFGH